MSEITITLPAKAQEFSGHEQAVVYKMKDGWVWEYINLSDEPNMGPIGFWPTAALAAWAVSYANDPDDETREFEDEDFGEEVGFDWGDYPE